MDIGDFLRFVITAKQGGWLNIAASEPDASNWLQFWRVWPNDEDSAVELIQGLRDSGKNVYYSPHLFTEQSTAKEYVMETRTIAADLDHAGIGNILLKPSMLVKSSDERHQAYWRLNNWIETAALEEISHRVTYGILDADHSGWSLGHMMRVPNTFNYKYVPPQKVRTVTHNGTLYTAEDFNVFPTLATSLAAAYEFDDEWIHNALKVSAGAKNVFDVWDAIEKTGKLAKGTEIHFYNEAADRSVALWRLMCELFRAGCTPEQVYLIAHSSKNNKFRDLRYNGERELAKDVMRARTEVNSGPSGIKTRVNQTRQLNVSLAQRRQYIADMVRNQMMSHGKFVHARGGTLWYILSSEGKPISVSRVSTQLNVILDTMFSLISTEAEHNYVVAHLINYTAALPPEGELAALSYYLEDNNTVLLHTGHKDVIRITTEAIDVVTNGYRNILFPWSEEGTFTPTLDVKLEQEWSTLLFEDSLENLATDGISPTQATALLRTWFMVLLLRNCITSRPILAIFGQPGSGKSTLFRRIYALLYGPHKAVSGITSPEDFDFQLASDPLVVIDNVDTWERWLPDRIARAAAVSEIKKRKLYTDTDTVTLRSQALLGITAHNPKFGREDVTDRLILITLERLTTFRSENEILHRVLSLRNDIWGAITHDLQLVLREPKAQRVPQFRVEDFAALGQRIANALGFADEFYTAITSMVQQQKGFVLDEDSMLVDLLDKYMKSRRYNLDEHLTPAKLWAELDLLSRGDRNFVRQYGNSIRLGKKLWAMMDALKQRFVVEWQFDPIHKTRVWRFAQKQTEATQ